VMTHTDLPSLVDVVEYIYPSADVLYQNRPDLQEIEKELRA